MYGSRDNSVPSAPPEGYTVDFSNPRRRLLIAAYTVTGVGIVISTAFLAQRLYVKRYLRKQLGHDDSKPESHTVSLSYTTNS